MAEEAAIEIQKKEIRERIIVLQELAGRLPDSKDEAIAQLGELKKKIRVMQEERKPSEAEDETCIGS